jgi:glucokinase
MDARVVGIHARTGDKVALRIFEQAGQHLGRAIGDLVQMLDVDTVVIGGGVAHAGEFFWKPLGQSFRCRTAFPHAKIARIRRAKLGNAAGIIGAILAAEGWITRQDETSQGWIERHRHRA